MEVIVAVGLLGLIAVAMAQFFASTTRVQKRAKVKGAMQFIAQDIENKLKTPSSLYLSLTDPSNFQFISCVLGAGDGCTSVLTKFDPNSPPSTWNYFALNYADTANSSLRMTSSSFGAPILYDTDGLPCPSKIGSHAPCVFQAYTFFYATCDPSDGNICKFGPAQVSVAYKVTQVPNTLTDLNPSFKALPEGIHFFTHQTKDILGPFSNSTCNPGAIIQGYDRRGYAKCKCSGKYVPNTDIPENRFGPLCRPVQSVELKCPDPNTVFRGLTPDGKANCVDPKDAYDCVAGTPAGSLQARCPTGYWVQEDLRQGCRYYCTIPKTDGTADCSSNEVGDNRDSKGQRRISDKIQPEEKTYDKKDQRVEVNALYKMGLICTGRILTCCRPK